MKIVVRILLLLHFSVRSGRSIKGCDSPLGMENKQIPDSSIKATSVIFNSPKGASNARLRYVASHGERSAWSPSSWEPGQWIQVDLGNITMVTKIATQGRQHWFEWVTEYKVSYSYDGGYFKFQQRTSSDQVFQGNSDDNSIVVNSFEPPIAARFIRVHPVKFQRWISLRMELYGCHSGFPPPKRPVCEAGLGLESYDIPDSSVTASSILWPPAQAANGRLHFFPKFGQNGGWVAHPSNTYGSWFQVDFGRWTKVTRISTQGRQDADEWVTKYGVSYSYEGIFFKGYQEHGGMPKIFDGNSNRYTVVSHKLKNPIITRYIRINPETHRGLISLRADFYGCISGFPAPEIPGCMNPLGMESGQISNNYVQASSQAYSTTGPENARLHFKGARGRIGAWIPKTHNRNEWLQIDFGNETRITGISTQGRYDADQWVMSYSLRYSYNGLYFIQYWPHLHTKKLSGNTDRENLVSHELIPPIRARYIKVIPESWHVSIALRVEFYGCLPEDGGYSHWSSWSQCSSTCGFGLHLRRRSCTNPPPGPYGNTCSYLGSSNQTEECNSGKECPQPRKNRTKECSGGQECPKPGNNKTKECSYGKECPRLGNNNQTAELCNGTNCSGSSPVKDTRSDSDYTMTYVATSIGLLVALGLFTGLLIKYFLCSRKYKPFPVGADHVNGDIEMKRITGQEEETQV